MPTFHVVTASNYMLLYPPPHALRSRLRFLLVNLIEADGYLRRLVSTSADPQQLYSKPDWICEGVRSYGTEHRGFAADGSFVCTGSGPATG